MRINREIRADSVRVIGSDGRQLGVMNFRQALMLAERENLDLVEIVPNATPPVCKIIDYGKLRYHQAKKEKEQKRAQHQIKVKEIKLKPNIDVHDFQTKLNRAKEFLSKGNKVRVTCMFRGREMLHVDLGRKLLQRFCEGLQELSSVEAPAKLMGKNLTLVVAPLGMKKVKVGKMEKSES